MNDLHAWWSQLSPQNRAALLGAAAGSGLGAAAGGVAGHRHGRTGEGALAGLLGGGALGAGAGYLGGEWFSGKKDEPPHAPHHTSETIDNPGGGLGAKILNWGKRQIDYATNPSETIPDAVDAAIPPAAGVAVNSDTAQTVARRAGAGGLTMGGVLGGHTLDRYLQKVIGRDPPSLPLTNLSRDLAVPGSLPSRVQVLGSRADFPVPRGRSALRLGSRFLPYLGGLAGATTAQAGGLTQPHPAE